jgi:hypothetical protein
MTKAFISNVLIIHMGKIPKQTVIVMTTAATIVIWISTLVMVIPQAAYATQDEENPPSSSDTDDCKSDEIPTSISRCIEEEEEEECYSYEFEGKEVKHCNY